MNRNRKLSLLALALIIIIFTTLLPSKVFAATKAVATISSSDNVSGIQFKYSTTGSTDADYLDYTDSVEITEISSMRLLLRVVIPNSSVPDGYELDYWDVNGKEVKTGGFEEGEFIQFSDPNFNVRTTDAGENNEGYITGTYAKDSRLEIRLRRKDFQNYDGQISWNIVAKFKPTDSQDEHNVPIFTPSVKVAEGMSEMGIINPDGLVFKTNATDKLSSKWELSTIPASGYELAFIQIGDNTATRINSVDGKSVTWDVSAADTEYLAYFRPATVHFGDEILYGLDSQPQSTQKVSAGQRVFFTNSCLSPVTTKAKFYLYAGEGTDGTLLGTNFGLDSTSGVDLSAGWEEKVTIFADSIPADLSRVTLAARIGEDGEITTKTFDVSVAPSGNTTLTYLDLPGYGIYGSAGDQGPAVYDIASCVDAASGALTNYFATNDGVVIGRDGTYRKIPGLSGHIITAGTDPSGVLYAISIEDTTIDNLGYKKYRLHKYDNDAWQTLEPNGYDVYSIDARNLGLIMDASNIWLWNVHWDGNSWEQNPTEFNTFWKVDSETAYAGSNEGLFRYKDGAWSKISEFTGGITSAYQTKTGVKLAVTRHGGRVSERLREGYNMSNVYLVTITDGADGAVSVSASATLDDSGINGKTGNDTSDNKYIGIAADGTVYAITNGRFYEKQSSAAYRGSYLYKYVDGDWQYQIVDSFNDPVHEDDNPQTKYRPDGIRYILSPYAGITYFLGDAGAIYAQYGKTTIRFVEDGGSEVADITKTIGSKVTAPASPEKEGHSFVGWYTDQEFSEASRYSFDRMPAKDITLYARWDTSGAALEQEKLDAKQELDTAYNGYTASDYDTDAWAVLEQAYTDGKVAIEAATSYDAIQETKNIALFAMAAVEKSRVMTVAVTVEKLTVDGNLIIEPTLITTDKNKQSSVVITDLLKDHYADYSGVPYRITGTIENNFYLAGIYDPTYDPSVLGAGFSQSHEGFLSEFDGGQDAGWMYCINGRFPNVGASDTRLKNRDVMRWQYTCRGLGADIGAKEFVIGESVKVADKDALIWRLAEINQDKAAFLAVAEKKAAYDTAMTVLKNITAPQAEVDAALIALGGTVEDPAEKLAKTKAEAIQTLQNYVQANDYREAEQALLAGYIADGEAAINAAEDAAAVNAALNNAQQLIDALKTDAEYTALENSGKIDVAKVYQTTQTYIRNKIPVPGVGSVGGEWVVVGLVRSGAEMPDAFKNGYYEAAVRYINEKMNDKGQLHRAKSTDNSRLILALTALGKDVTSISGRNLLTALADLDYLKIQGINGPIWALIAFDTYDYKIPVHTGSGTQTTRENLISAVLAAQLEDGGWALAGKKADPDMTAMALQSLAKYYHSHAEVKAAADRAIEKLSAMQQPTGGYSSWGTTNSESCAQVITALTALGIDPATDPRFIKNNISVVDALCSFYVEGGGFKHVLTGQLDGMATEQGYYALVSWYRLKEGKTRLYDMTDVKITAADQVQDVMDLIDAIGEVKADSGKAITAARKAYDALSDAEKKLVANYNTLVAAEAALKTVAKPDAVKMIQQPPAWTKGSGEPLSFTSDADFADFLHVKVDGEVVDKSNYDVKAGSTIVTFKPAFLETLSAGKHTVEIVSASGSAHGIIEIKAETKEEDTKQTIEVTELSDATPKTGEGSGQEPWLALLFLSIGGLIFLARKKRTFQRRD